MKESVLHVALTREDVAALLNAADRIYSFIGYAQGEEARFQNRRDQLVVLPVVKKKLLRKRRRKKLRKGWFTSQERRLEQCQPSFKKYSQFNYRSM